MNTWSYNIDQLSEISTDRLLYLKEKYEYEIPQLEEDSVKHSSGMDALVKIQIELDHRGQEGA